MGCSQGLHVLEAQERMGVLRCQSTECGAGKWEKSSVLLLPPEVWVYPWVLKHIPQVTVLP